MPPLPLVVKSLIFYISDIGGNFSHIPALFPRSLEYVLLHGLLTTSNSKFYTDSNAVECLRNFSYECLELFTPEMISRTLQVCTSVLSSMPANYCDKLIEAVITIISKLPALEVVQAQRDILTFILTELQSASLPGLPPRPQVHYKGVVLMAAAFGAISENSSQELWNNLQDIILQTVSLTLQGLKVYSQQENIILASYVLFRKVIKLASIFADSFFPSICDSIIEMNSQGKEEGFGVIIGGISLLFNEPNTTQWLLQTYQRLFAILYTELSSNPTPEAITTFFDLQSKLYESGISVFAQTLSETLNAAVSVSNSLHDRNASKSVLLFCQLMFGSRVEQLSQHSFLLTRSLLCGLGTINNNAYQSLCTLINTLRTNYSVEFCEGVRQAFYSETFNRFGDKERERLIYCMVNVEIDTIQPMKQLLSTIGSILRGKSNFEALITTEIAISSRSLAKI